MIRDTKSVYYSRLRGCFSVLTLGAITVLPGLISAEAFAAGIDQIYTHGSYETAGITLYLSSDSDRGESANLEIRDPVSDHFVPAHDFVRYDTSNMASSLFSLEADTSYDVRITLIDPDDATGANPRIVQFTTKPYLSIPITSHTLTVAASGADFTSIEAAVNAVLPGDEVLVLPVTYGGSCAVERCS